MSDTPINDTPNSVDTIASPGLSDQGVTQPPLVTTAPVVKHKAIFFSRFTMRAPLVVGGQARPDVESLMMFGIYRENPRITVRTNDPADENNNYGKVVAAMDPVTWGVLVATVKALCLNPVKDVKAIGNYNIWKGGQKFDEPQFINNTLIGRDEDGRIWLKVVEENRPASAFYFGPPRYHKLLRMDKTEVPTGESSQMYALATMEMLTKVMTTSMGKRDDGEDDSATSNAPGAGVVASPSGAFPRQQGGGGGGGWQQRGGGGGNWNRGGGGGGGGGWQQRGGGGGGGNWNRGGGGGSGNWNRGGGGGGGNQGGGGNWNRGGGNQGGGNQGGAPANVSNDEITF